MTNGGKSIPLHNSSDKLGTVHRTLIGAAGGFSLVLLKLIDANFFYGAATTKIVVGYLTYASYIVLGMIVASFLSDHELSKEKAKRQALIMGLLAPSILVAIITNPDSSLNTNSRGADINSTPDLGFNFFMIGKLNAEEILVSEKPVENKDTLPLDTTIRKSDVEPSVKDTFLNVIGREEFHEKYVFTIGRSEDKGKALEVASKLNDAMQCNDSYSSECARLITPQGSRLTYVTLGGLQNWTHVQDLKSTAFGRVISKANEHRKLEDPKTLSLISGGKIVEGAHFFTN